MSFKISKTKLALYVSTLLIFLPISDLFYGNPLIKIAVNINYAYILGFIAIMVASKQMRIFGKSKILMLFFLVMTISTLVNSGIYIFAQDGYNNSIYSCTMGTKFARTYFNCGKRPVDVGFC